MKSWTNLLSSLSFFISKNTNASYWPVLVLVLLLTNGCSGNGDSVPAERHPIVADVLTATVPVPAGPPLALTAGVPATASVYIELPDGFEMGQLAEASIDPVATLSTLTIVRTDGGGTPSPTIEFSLQVAAGNDADACNNGTQALRAEITGNTDFSNTSVSVDETTMPQIAVDIINSGAFTLCTSATSSVDVNLTLTGLGVSFGVDGNCAAPQDLSGLWIGDYHCDDNCDGNPSTEDGQVEITVTQSGDTAMYQDDGGAVYAGSVCANAFNHLGLGGGYFEYGTFTRTGPTTATKTSTWVSTNIPNCGGTCSDTLTLN